MTPVSIPPMTAAEASQLSQACGLVHKRRYRRLSAAVEIDSLVAKRAAKACARTLRLMKKSLLGESPYFQKRIPVWFMDHKAARYPITAADLAGDLYLSEKCPKLAGMLRREQATVNLTDPNLELPDHHRSYLNHLIMMAAEFGYDGQKDLASRDQFDRQMSVAICAYVANQVVREHGSLPVELKLNERVRGYLDELHQGTRSLEIDGLLPEGKAEFSKRLEERPPGCEISQQAPRSLSSCRPCYC